MKAVVAQSDFDSILKVLSQSIDKRAKHPVLDNVMLTADADAGSLVATVYSFGNDYKVGRQVWATIPASVAESGSITVPVVSLKDAVGLIDKSIPVELSFDGSEEGAKLVVASGKGSVKIHTIASEDFPAPMFKAGDNDIEFSVPSVDFLKGVKNSLFAASTDLAKKVLCAVNLKLVGNSLTFAATDGHRLSVISLEDVVDTGESEFEYSLPQCILKDIVKMIGTKPKFPSVSFRASKFHLEIAYGVYKFHFNKIDGQYPNYRQLTPDKFMKQATIDRGGLLASLNRAGTVANLHNNVVKLTFNQDSGNVSITAGAGEVMNFEEELPFTGDCDDFAIAFNVRYLIDVLKVPAMAGSPGNDAVTIKMNAPTTPAVMVPDNLNTTAFHHLVMPVQIRS